VTGSHALKVGISVWVGVLLATARRGGRISFSCIAPGVPAQVIIHNTPQDSFAAMNADEGIYAQDS